MEDSHGLTPADRSHLTEKRSRLFPTVDETAFQLRNLALPDRPVNRVEDGVR